MITKNCEICGAAFVVRPYRAKSARFCSQRCGGTWHARTRLAAMPHTWMLGNKLRVGLPSANPFPRGHIPWNKNLRGLHLSPATEFVRGQRAHNKLPVGSTRIRTHRGETPRAWIKVAEPNTWRPRAIVVWEKGNGPLPRGWIVHHRNRQSLDDRPSNLVALTRAQHLAEHRHE